MTYLRKLWHRILLHRRIQMLIDIGCDEQFAATLARRIEANHGR